MQVFQSRWGYHPCDFEGFTELKRFHRAYWEGLKLLAAWKRWSSKRPHNRVRHRRLRDAAGRKIGREVVGPLPEPVVPAVYREICQGPYNIVAEYHSARHGKPREEVKPLAIPAEKIQEWIAGLERA